MVEDETLIYDAIHKRHRVAFGYRDRKRIVEPYAYGVDSGGSPILRGYQTAGESHSGVPAWKLFRVEEIVDLRILDETFDAPHEGYMRNDPSMTKVYCEI